MPAARCSSSSTSSTLGMRRLRLGFRLALGLEQPRQRDREGRAAVRPGAVDGDRAAMALDDRADDEKPEPGPGPAASHLGPDPVEAREDERQVRAADADAAGPPPHLPLALP